MKKISRKIFGIKKELHKYFFSKKMLRLFKSIHSSRGYTYEPVKIEGRFYDGKREWEERWKLIKKELLHYKAKNVLDIGSSESWFVRLASEELGLFALGVDSNNKRVLTGEITRLYDQVENCATIKSLITPTDIKLPVFDVVICLSVVHHIIRKEGLDNGREFIKSISSCADRAIIFEMGTSEEKKMMWHTKMPNMEDGQSEFLRELLKSAGLKNIRVIGATPSIERDSKRIMLVAET